MARGTGSEHSLELALIGFLSYPEVGSGRRAFPGPHLDFLAPLTPVSGGIGGRSMHDTPTHWLSSISVDAMSAERRIAEISRILAAGLLRARAKGTLPAVKPDAPKRGKATRARR